MVIFKFNLLKILKIDNWRQTLTAVMCFFWWGPLSGHLGSTHVFRLSNGRNGPGWEPNLGENTKLASSNLNALLSSSVLTLIQFKLKYFKKRNPEHSLTLYFVPISCQQCLFLCHCGQKKWRILSRPIFLIQNCRLWGFFFFFFEESRWLSTLRDKGRGGWEVDGEEASVFVIFFPLNITEIASLETTGGKRERIVLTADFYSLLSHETDVFFGTLWFGECVVGIWNKA